jgi:hypothetical protein
MTVEVAPPRTVEVDEEALAAAGGGPAAAAQIAAAAAAAASAGGRSKGFAGGDPSGGGGGAPGRTRKVLVPVEQSVRKMAEKYRRDPTGEVPAHEDAAKIVYLIDADAIQVSSWQGA